jgi:pimeloyl-ACP methyl ester carboxylesterase
MATTKPRFIAESVCVPGDANTTFVAVPRPMPCIVIFVHGVNSEGEWYRDAESGLINGLNDRLGRVDLKRNGCKYEKNVAPDFRPLNGLDLKNSPVIRFYWGYRAPKEQTDKVNFPWRIPLKTRVTVPSVRDSLPYAYPAYSYKPDSYDPPKPNVKGSVYYWGGGPFQNGTTALNMSWYDGFDPKVWGINISSPAINPERDRPLNASPRRTYYVNASKRLAKLIDTIYEAHPNDTIAVVSHSQGTMIASLAMFYVKKVPDTLFLCNSPYRLTKTGLDDFQMGNAAPTTKARVRTFFNLLQRFKDFQDNPDAEAKVTPRQLEGVGGWFDVPADESSDTDDRSVKSAREPTKIKWTPSNPSEMPNPGDKISSHDNRGRVFIYCSPHDRVMGSTPIESIGWKGVDKMLPDPDRPNPWEMVDPFDRYKGVLFQRQFMRGHEVGGKPDANTPRCPSDGQPWIPKSPKIMGFSNELASIDPKETLNVNGPAVPNPVSANDMARFDEDTDQRDHVTLADDDDFRYYKELLYDKPKWVPEAPTPYENSNQQRNRLQTPDEVADEFRTTIATPTNHSTILNYGGGMLAERVMAYDLPIGRADSFADRLFWKKLLRMADWLEEDPEYAAGGDFRGAGDPPAGVDCETNGDLNLPSLYKGS